ncbi:hypothetical protein ATW79_03960 [Oenococcus oeni]|nr:hypothetical protein ATW79_03960 [Oenococcus oeni]OIL14984.1 hypothetical protein ATW93_03960 [Oenococcus oeni]
MTLNPFPQSLGFIIVKNVNITLESLYTNIEAANEIYFKKSLCNAPIQKRIELSYLTPKNKYS